MLRVLIVDDEAPARRYLRRLLEAMPNIDVAGEASTIEQAHDLIQAHAPDALFLDIELTSGTGFDLLSRLESAPTVVFVTAHNDYATRAFDVAAVDYLLKPVSPDRLARALTRLRPRATGYVPMKTKVGTKLIKVERLTLVQAQGDYVRLCSAANDNELMHITLKRLAAHLPYPPFCALSRSIIINLEHIAQLSPLSGAQTEVSFSNGVAPIVLGRVASLRLRRAVARS